MTTSPPRVGSRAPALRSLVVGLVVAAAGIAAVLGVRAVYRSHYEESHHYASAAAVPAHNGVFALPEWAPADATDITLRVQTEGRGRSTTLTGSGELEGHCRPAPAPRADPVPALDLPTGVRSGTGERCGTWFVARRGASVYAWEAYR